MQNALVDNKPRAYKCPSESEPDGTPCTGTLVFQVGQLVQQCPNCGGWTGIAAPGLVELTVQTGAVTGARNHWALGKSYNLGGSAGFSLECGIDNCHFRKHISAYRVHASAVNALMDEHPCPMPREEPVIEPLPVAEEREPSDWPDGH